MPVERCPICGGPVEQRAGMLTHVYRGTVIKVEGVPQLVCMECGEVMIDSQFGRIIEESIDQYRLSKKHDYNDLLTCEEVAALFAVSYQVIVTMLNDGKLPGTKIGREWRVPYGLLMDFVQGMSAYNLTLPEKDIHRAFLELKSVVRS